MFAGMSKHLQVVVPHQIVHKYTSLSNLIVLPPLPLKLLQLAIGTFAILRISSHVVVWKSTVHETHFYRSRCRKVCLGSRLDCWTVTVHKLAVGIDGRWQSGESDHAC
jgi:hypothetical protein